MIPRIPLALAVLCLSTAAMAAEPQDYGKMPADLAPRAEAFDAAQINGDGKALADLLADDYMLVNSSARIENKAQFIADYTDPNFKLLPFTIGDQVVRAWDKGAVLGGRVLMRFTDHGKPGQAELHFADVWAKRDGKWRVIFTEVTRVPKK